MERKKDKVVLFLVQLAFYTVLILNLLSFRGVYELPYRRLFTYLSAACIINLVLCITTLSGAFGEQLLKSMLPYCFWGAIIGIGARMDEKDEKLHDIYVGCGIGCLFVSYFTVVLRCMM